jgi:hypothetical protein
MNRSKYSEYENYIILSDKSKRQLKGTYVSFLNFQKVMVVVDTIAKSDKSSYLHEGNIYSRKVTTSDAQKVLTNVHECRWNNSTYQMKIIASQLKMLI